MSGPTSRAAVRIRPERADDPAEVAEIGRLHDAAIADQRPEPLMVVQGHPTYYPRFGFVRGRTIGILPPEHLGGIDRAWLVRPRPGADGTIRGRVLYPQHFMDLDEQDSGPSARSATGLTLPIR